MGTTSSQEVICIPKHTCFVTTDADSRLAMVTNRAAGTVDIDATVVKLWSTPTPLYLLPASVIADVPVGSDYDKQVASICTHHGCDGVLRGRVILTHKALHVVRAGSMKPRQFRKHRRRFIARLVRKCITVPAGFMGSTSTTVDTGTRANAVSVGWARAPTHETTTSHTTQGLSETVAH